MDVQVRLAGNRLRAAIQRKNDLSVLACQICSPKLGECARKYIILYVRQVHLSRRPLTSSLALFLSSACSSVTLKIVRLSAPHTDVHIYYSMTNQGSRTDETV